jgi:hypothetical protein
MQQRKTHLDFSLLALINQGCGEYSMDEAPLGFIPTQGLLDSSTTLR